MPPAPKTSGIGAGAAGGVFQRRPDPQTGTDSRVGWLALGLGGVSVCGLALVGKAGLLNAVFPVLCLGCAALLTRRPGSYVTFVLGVWIWAPAVRRVADWQSAYNPLSPVLLAPILATLACLAAPGQIVRGFRTMPALVIPIVALCVGVLTGFVNNSPASALYAGVTWMTPIFFAAYIAGCRDVTGRLEAKFLSSVTLMAFWAAIYGIFQFISPPIWDRFWMIGSQMLGIGLPAPFRVRVFGPLNSPVPFAAVMVAGLIAGFLDARKSRWLLLPCVFVALLLSLVRSEWLAVVVAFVAILVAAPARALQRSVRLGVMVLVLAVTTAPLLSYGPIATAVGLRLQSLHAGGQDASLRDRLTLYRNFELGPVLLGEGLGSTDAATRLSGGDARLDARRGNIDSALLHLVTGLGVPFAILFGSGLVWLLAGAARGAARSNMATAGLALAVAGLSQSPSYNVLISGPAVLMYAGFVVGARHREPLEHHLEDVRRGRREMAGMRRLLPRRGASEWS